MDLGTNDTSICWEAPPLSVIFGVNYSENTLFHPARCDMYIALETQWHHSSLCLKVSGPCRSIHVLLSP